MKFHRRGWFCPRCGRLHVRSLDGVMEAGKLHKRCVKCGQAVSLTVKIEEHIVRETIIVGAKKR